MPIPTNPAPPTPPRDRDDRAQDEAIEASFPSSDPPSWTRLHAGSPNAAHERPPTAPGGPGRGG